MEPETGLRNDPQTTPQTTPRNPLPGGGSGGQFGGSLGDPPRTGCRAPHTHPRVGGIPPTLGQGTPQGTRLPRTGRVRHPDLPPGATQDPPRTGSWRYPVWQVWGYTPQTPQTGPSGPTPKLENFGLGQKSAKKVTSFRHHFFKKLEKFGLGQNFAKKWVARNRRNGCPKSGPESVSGST